MPTQTDISVSAADISRLSSADALTGWLTALGYDTAARKALTPQAIGLSPEAATAFKQIELLSEDAEGFLRVVFCQLRSLTAKSRNELARMLGRLNVDHLLILTSDFSTLEFVLLDKRRRDARGPGATARIQVVPLVLAVPRKAAGAKELRILRRLTWTSRDGLEQFDKLRATFAAAAFSEDYFCNRALFADHYLMTRLREDAAWRENPSQVFHSVKSLLADARSRWYDKGEDLVRRELFEPIFKLLGFNPASGTRECAGSTASPSGAPAAVGRNKNYREAGAGYPRADGQPTPDYLLRDAAGKPLTAALVYAWDRWLDGPDFQLDRDTPDENPGASVVSALEAGLAEWIIVTNGRQWRLYSRQAHSRATNFYEVDLAEALVASGDTDPNEAFRYWWLFFRRQAFLPSPSGRGAGGEGAGIQPTPCWLDAIAGGSRDYAKELGERLKTRVFLTIFPHLARGFLEDRKSRLGRKVRPSDDELRDVFEATLTLLYRLLFLLYAEARDLLPMSESPYREASLRRIKEEIAEAAGIAESEVDQRLKKAYSASDTTLYDRLARLSAAMDRGDAALNVPTYNGGLFSTSVGNALRGVPRNEPPTPPTERHGVRPLQSAAAGESREQRIARFLIEHKVPDRALALAIDHLARDPDDKTDSLVFIDYKSLEVRHLGSIYEGLLEFQLKLADEDLTTQTDKKGEKYIPLGQAKSRRGRAAEVVVSKGEVYLSNDKAQRKASGSYYTPDPIVKYIVEHAVGPVLAEKLESLRNDFRQVRKVYDREVEKATNFPVKKTAETGTGSFCAQHPQGRSGKTYPSPFPQDDSTYWDPRELAAEKTYAECRGLVERLFEFRVLDPAMGSGHFLVEAVDFITDRLLTFLNQFPINPVTFVLARTRRNILEALAEQGVSVDPDKLTDVNLLKRHVLKRCIYGVDLNPMAVELAKVSLWLDAFTLGAPLSFLDHHLRCGNSLIGATFNDLAGATKGRLFGIDYEPLLRAIRHVLQVNKMADATAAEVKQSASEYDHAREELSGYQIVLDLLVAKHFGHPKAPGLLEHGDNLDLTSRARFMASLDDLEELALVERVEALARQPDRRFFHWEIEFPEVFFGFSDANERHLKHKNEIAEGSAGFDAVVGNPPYVRQEALKGVKPYLSETYECYHSIADIFAYFYDRGSNASRNGGYVAFITSGSWMKANFGGPLRAILATRMNLRSVIDFGEWQPFPGAEMIRPSIVLLRRGRSDTKARVFRFLTKGNPPADLIAAVADSPEVETASLGREEWHLESSGLSSIYGKLLANGVSLASFTNEKILSGVKTGLSDAFVIDGTTRAKIIGRNPPCADVIKPYLDGKDLRQWHVEMEDRWLVLFPKGFTQAAIGNAPLPEAEEWLRGKYTALYETLLEHRDAALKRQDMGDYWWEVRACDYYDRYEKPKIVWPDIAKLPRFSMESGKYYFGNTGYMIPLEDYFLLGVLASWPMWFMISRTCQPLRLRAGRWQYRLFRQYMERLPIPKDVDAASREAIASLAQKCSQLGPASYHHETDVFASIRSALMPGEKKPPQALRRWWESDFESFKEAVESLQRNKLSGGTLSSWETRLAQEKASRQAIRSQLESAEAELSERVARAFGLNSDEYCTVKQAVSS